MQRRVQPYLELRERAEPLTAEQEAESLLLALAGHPCVICEQTLGRDTGYACCGIAYCPICGVIALHCGHCVARKAHKLSLLGRDGLPLRLVGKPAVKAGQFRERCAELAGQQVLALDATCPHLTDQVQVRTRCMLDGNTLKEYLLATCLCPDVRTAYQFNTGHHTYHYFSHDPDAARARALHVATTMRKVI